MSPMCAPNFVVGHELRAPSNVTLVLAMTDLPFDSHDDRLLHLVAGNQADFLLAAMSGRLPALSVTLDVGLSDSICRPAD